MSNELSDEKIEEMFRAYCKKKSYNYVSKTLHVSRQAVKKYCNLGKWDNRIAKLNAKVEEKIDDSIATVKAKYIGITRGIIGRYAKWIRQLQELEITPSDYEKLVKLDMLLSGEVTERTEQRHQF